MNFRKTLVAGIVVAGTMLSMAIQGWAGESIEIQHRLLLCVAREKPFEVRFKLLSDQPIREARVYFRSREAEHFYFTPAHKQENGEFLAMLPGADSTVSVLEYALLLVEENERAVKSPVIALAADEEEECQENQIQAPEKLIISSEYALDAELGFSGDVIVWELPDDDAENTHYFSEADERLLLIDVMLAEPSESSEDMEPVEQPVEETSESTDDEAASSTKRRISKKTMLGIGAAGVGALGVAGAVFAGGDDGGSENIWKDVDDVTGEVVSVLNKVPAVQTTCGTVVTNQLSVTNNTSEIVHLGTVDYEIILTKSSPSGSCRPGRIGAFAPGGKTSLEPGESVLIREWSNDVNPCSGCPYPSAECVWESRYIVYTSLGSSVVMSSFSAQGNLCRGSAQSKALGQSQQLCGSDAP